MCDKTMFLLSNAEMANTTLRSISLQLALNTPMHLQKGHVIVDSIFKYTIYK